MCMSRLHRVVGECETWVDVEDVDGAVHRVSLLALDGPAPAAGEWLVVHSGYAIDRVDGCRGRGGGGRAPTGRLARSVGP